MGGVVLHAERRLAPFPGRAAAAGGPGLPAQPGRGPCACVTGWTCCSTTRKCVQTLNLHECRRWKRRHGRRHRRGQRSVVLPVPRGRAAPPGAGRAGAAMPRGSPSDGGAGTAVPPSAGAQLAPPFPHGWRGSCAAGTAERRRRRWQRRAARRGGELAAPFHRATAARMPTATPVGPSASPRGGALHGRWLVLDAPAADRRPFREGLRRRRRRGVGHQRGGNDRALPFRRHLGGYSLADADACPRSGPRRPTTSGSAAPTASSTGTDQWPPCGPADLAAAARRERALGMRARRFLGGGNVVGFIGTDRQLDFSTCLPELAAWAWHDGLGMRVQRRLGRWHRALDGIGRIIHWDGNAWSTPEAPRRPKRSLAPAPRRLVAGAGAAVSLGAARRRTTPPTPSTSGPVPGGPAPDRNDDDAHAVSVLERRRRTVLPGPAPAGVNSLWGRSADRHLGRGRAAAGRPTGRDALEARSCPVGPQRSGDAVGDRQRRDRSLGGRGRHAAARGWIDLADGADAAAGRRAHLRHLGARARRRLGAGRRRRHSPRERGRVDHRDPPPHGAPRRDARHLGHRPEDVWILRGSNSVLHLDRYGWHSFQPGVEHAVAVWASGPGDAWVVGDQAAHWNGSGWWSVQVPSIVGGAPFVAVSGSGPSDVWALAGGSLLHATKDQSFTAVMRHVVAVHGSIGGRSGRRLAPVPGRPHPVTRPALHRWRARPAARLGGARRAERHLGGARRHDLDGGRRRRDLAQAVLSAPPGSNLTVRTFSEHADQADAAAGAVHEPGWRDRRGAGRRRRPRVPDVVDEREHHRGDGPGDAQAHQDEVAAVGAVL